MQKYKRVLLQKLANIVIKYSKQIVCGSILLALISGLYAFFFLHFDTNQDNLVSNKLAYHQEYMDFIDEFNDQENIFVVFKVSDDNPQKAKQVLKVFVDRISSRKDLFSEIKYRENLSVFEKRGLLLLPQQEFDSLTTKLSQWKNEVKRLGSIQNLADLFGFAAEKLELPSEKLKNNADNFESGFRFISQVLDGMDSPEIMKNLDSHSLFQPLLGKQHYHDSEGFFFSENGKLLFLSLAPAKDYTSTSIVKKPLRFLREQADILRKEFPDVPFGITGKPVLQDDEMASTGSDSIWAGLASLLGVAFLFMFYFKQTTRPLMALLALVLGMSWTIGLTTLVLGHLNVLTIVFAVILIGIGIDYGMHFLFRLESLEKDGLPLEEATKQTMISSGQAIITGALTSSIAFFSAIFTDFLGLKELGIIAGNGILLCLVSQLVTFPSLLLTFKKQASQKARVQFMPLKLLDGMTKHPRFYMGITIALTLAAIPLALRVHFENNLLKLQDPHLESVQYEHVIIDNSKRSTWFAAMITQNMDQLIKLNEETNKIPLVGSTDSILSFIPFNQDQKVSQLQDIAHSLSLKRKTQTPFEASPLQTSLNRFKKALEHVNELAFEGGDIQAIETIDKLISKIDSVLAKLESSDPKIIEQLDKSQNLFLDFFTKTWNGFLENLNPKPMDESELPPGLRSLYVNEKNNYVLYIYPEFDIWEAAPMKEFIHALRKLDPHVTGSPVHVHESAQRMHEGFVTVGLLTLLISLIVLYIDFGQLKFCLVASIPLLVGTWWLAELMGIFGINLNLANFFAMPILIGVGIDSGVHMVHHYSEHKSIVKMLHRVGPPVIFSVLTTVIGFGALSFVRHRGLASFGQMMTLGSFTCLMACLVLIPLILKLTEGKK